MFTIIRIWLQYLVVRHELNVAKAEGYEKLRTGKLYPAVDKKLFAAGYEQYTRGGYLGPKEYYWTTTPVQSEVEDG